MASFLDQSKVEHIMDMGFSEEQAAAALTAAQGNLEVAVNYCLSEIPRLTERNNHEIDSDAIPENGYDVGYLSSEISLEVEENKIIITSLLEMTDEALYGDIQQQPFLLTLLECFDEACTQGVPMDLEAFKAFLKSLLSKQLSPMIASFLQDLMSNTNLSSKSLEVGALANEVCASAEIGLPILTAGLFRLFDKEDHNGIISRKEFMVTLLSFNSLASSPVIALKTFFDLVDSNSNGRVELKELADFVLELAAVPIDLAKASAYTLQKILKSGPVEQAAAEMILMFDADGNGTVDAKEFASAVSSLIQSVLPDSLPQILSTARKEQLLTEFLSRATECQMPKADAIDLYSRLLHELLLDFTDEVRPTLIQACTQISTEFPFRLQQVLPIFTMAIDHFFAFVKGPGIRRTVAALMTLFDIKNNGMINENEIRFLLAGLSNEIHMEEYISEIFRLFDEDGDGRITKKEAMDVLGKFLGFATEIVCVCLDLIKHLLGAILLPVLGLVASMVGDGTSFTFDELMNLSKLASDGGAAQVSTAAREVMSSLPFM